MFLIRIGGGVCTKEVAANDDFSLDHGLATKNNIRGPDDLGASRDFVSCVLIDGGIVSFGFFAIGSEIERLE